MQKLSMDDLNRKSVDDFKAANKNKIVVVLDNIRSMHNVGSVFRTADAFLIESIILTGFTPKPPHRDIHKTALGATETVHWVYEENIVDAVKNLKANGYQIFAIEQTSNSISLENFSNSNIPIAVVLGNEVEGVNASILPICNGCIEIPQLGSKHSLNVSVAAGIVLWKLVEPVFKLK
jgi:23S rRNA (guanosine2251-2'-O)-methyltransferase